MKTAMRLTLVALVFATTACAPSANENLEQARFALDSGTWDKAITEAGAVLTSDPANVEAAMLLSSAYAGRGGVRLLEVMAEISESGNAGNEFQAVNEAFVRTITSLDDLRLAVDALQNQLTTQPTSTHEFFKNHQFQLGILALIEAYSLPSLTSKAAGETDPTASRISAAHRSVVEADFLLADGHLINGGMGETEEIIVNLRKNYCVLQEATPAGSTGKFTLESLQDLNLCQLHSNQGSLGDSDIASTGITGCSTFDDFFNSNCSNAGTVDTQ